MRLIVEPKPNKAMFCGVPQNVGFSFSFQLDFPFIFRYHLITLLFTLSQSSICLLGFCVGLHVILSALFLNVGAT